MSKVKELLVRNQVKNIVSVYKQAYEHEIEAGMLWYKQANEFAVYLHKKHGVDFVAACGIISAMSPGVTWDRNKIDAEDIIKQLSRGKKVNPYRYATYPNNARKAELIYHKTNDNDVYKILLGKTGYKTASFFMNILGDLTKYVTVDRHAYKAANNIYEGGSVTVTPRMYRDTVSAYIQAAEVLSIEPAQLQAVVWVTYRRLAGLVKQEDENYVEPF